MEEIERILVRYGATEFQYGWRDNEARIAFGIADRRILFHLPLPLRDDYKWTAHRPPQRRSKPSWDAAYEQAVRQRYRALALIIKAKLEAVASGITTMEVEFLAHILLPDGSTVGEQVLPRVALAYERGEVPELLPGR
jgi:hypothetical protein